MAESMSTLLYISFFLFVFIHIKKIFDSYSNDIKELPSHQLITMQDDNSDYDDEGSVLFEGFSTLYIYSENFPDVDYFNLSEEGDYCGPLFM